VFCFFHSAVEAPSSSSREILSYDVNCFYKSKYQQPEQTSFHIFGGRRGYEGNDKNKKSTAGMLRLYDATTFVVAAQYWVN
jgi:hypothetical protein